MVHADTTPNELQEAHRAAGMLITNKYRSYLPGRMLAMLLGRFRDDMAEELGMDLPPLPQRQPARPAKLDELTSAELDALSGAVLALVTRLTALMDDPLLPELLRELRDVLVIEKADRARIAGELRARARALRGHVRACGRPRRRS